jgi:hypothetical protein
MIRGLPRFPVSVLVAKAGSLHAVSRRRLAALMLFLDEGWQPSQRGQTTVGNIHTSITL